MTRGGPEHPIEERPLRIATRRSRLATLQTRLVAQALRTEVDSRIAPELVPFSTRGDTTAGKLASAGGKGLFTAELEEALLGGEVDMAVHSAKDMPAGDDDRFVLVVPKRADPRDALVSRHEGGIDGLPAGARVGTGSPRRKAQLLRLRPDCQVVPLRGNVDTRLGKALGPEGELDAAVLAMAGLERSGLLGRHAERIHPLAIEQMVPAGGQGCLSLQVRADDARTMALVGALEDEASKQSLRAERGALRELEASCHSCLGVHVAPSADGWSCQAMAAREDGSGMVRLSARGKSASEATAEVVAQLLESGAAALLHPDRT